MSRIERTPTVSPPSTTTRWRKPPRTIASAARSSDQSGAAKVSVAGEVVADLLGVGVLAGAERLERSRSVRIPGPGLLGVDHDRRADAALGHQPGGLAKGVAGSDRQDRRAHSVPHLH